MAKIRITSSPSDVNAILRDACGKGLLPFADAIRTVTGIVQVDRDGKTSGSGWGWNQRRVPVKEWNHLRRRFQTLKKRCIEDLIDFESTLIGRQSPSSIAYKKNHDTEAGTVLILEKFPQLGAFTTFLDETIQQINSRLKFVSSMKGAPLQKTNLLVSFWGFIWAGGAHGLQSSTRRIDWKMLIDLYSWFWNHLGSYKVYALLRPRSEDLDPEYFEKQFYRHRTRNLKIYENSPYVPASEGYFLWLGKDRIYDFGWYEVCYTGISERPSHQKSDDLVVAEKKLKEALAGKQRFQDAVMLPDLSFFID